MNANTSNAAIESLSSNKTYQVQFGINFNSSNLDYGHCGWSYSDTAEGTTASPGVPHKPNAPTVTQNSTTPKTKLDVSWRATYGAPAVTDRADGRNGFTCDRHISCARRNTGAIDE